MHQGMAGQHLFHLGGGLSYAKSFKVNGALPVFSLFPLLLLRGVGDTILPSLFPGRRCSPRGLPPPLSSWGAGVAGALSYLHCFQADGAFLVVCPLPFSHNQQGDAAERLLRLPTQEPVNLVLNKMLSRLLSLYSI